MAVDDLCEAMRRSLTPWSFAEMIARSSRQGVTAAVADGRIVRVLPDHYASPIHAESWLVRVRAALSWAGPAALVGGVSALHAWQVARQPLHVSLAAPWEDRPRGPQWLRIRRFTTMPERFDIAGLRTVGPELAVILAHAELPPGRRAEAVYGPLRTGLVTVESVAAALESVARVRGRRELTRRLAAADAGAESYLEEEAGSTVLRGPRFSEVVRQHSISVGDDVFRLDAFDARSLTAFEFDGESTHGSPEARRRDLARDAILATVGIQTVRFDYADVMGRPEWCREVALETMSRRELTVPQRERAAQDEY